MPTQHQSVYEGGHETWRGGVSCDECDARAAEIRARHRGGTLTVIPPLGTQSLNPKMQEFWHGENAGDPAIFDRP